MKQKQQNQIATVIVLAIAAVTALYYVGSLDFNPVQAFNNAMPDVVVIKVKQVMANEFSFMFINIEDTLAQYKEGMIDENVVVEEIQMALDQYKENK